jgi:uncharacterized protein with HEPN domain
MNDRDIKAISRIVVHIENIIEYMKSVKSLYDFSQNQLVVDAVVFNLSQIGEISKFRVSSNLKEWSKHIPCMKCMALEIVLSMIMIKSI